MECTVFAEPRSKGSCDGVGTGRIRQFPYLKKVRRIGSLRSHLPPQQSVRDVLDVLALNYVQLIDSKQRCEAEAKTMKVVLGSRDPEVAFQQLHS